MREFNKTQRKLIKPIIKKGILRRHAEWQNELRELLDSPFDHISMSNEFDRSMLITDKARKFYKEAMRLEDYYRSSWLDAGVTNLLIDGYLTFEDLSELPDELQEYFNARMKLYEEFNRQNRESETVGI